MAADSLKVVFIMPERKFALELAEVLHANFKGRLQVVGFAFTPLRVNAAFSLRPNLVFLHIDFDPKAVLRIASEVKLLAPQAKVVGISRSYDLKVETVFRSAGACGYFVEADNMIIMLDLVDRVARLAPGTCDNMLTSIQ